MNTITFEVRDGKYNAIIEIFKMEFKAGGLMDLEEKYGYGLKPGKTFDAGSTGNKDREFYDILRGLEIMLPFYNSINFTPSFCVVNNYGAN